MKFKEPPKNCMLFLFDNNVDFVKESDLLDSSSFYRFFILGTSW